MRQIPNDSELLFVPLRRIEKEGLQLVSYTDILAFNQDGTLAYFEKEASSESVLADDLLREIGGK